MTTPTQTPRQRYLDNLALIEPFNYASQLGVLYDKDAAEAIRAQLTPKMWEAQAAVDGAAGRSAPCAPDDVLAAAAALLCNKVQLRKQLAGWKERVAVLDADGAPVLKKGKPLRETREHAPRSLSWTLALATANKDCRQPLLRLKELLSTDPTPAARAEIATLLNVSLNPESNPQVAAALAGYGVRLKAKESRTAPEDGDASAPPGSTCDAAFLLDLYVRLGAHPERAFTSKEHVGNAPRVRALALALLATRALRDRLGELDRVVDPDGRIRSSYTIAGPKTDRTASRAWLTGSGGNVQTVPKQPVNFRVCYRSDPGHAWFKLDLTGADLWTVAARCALQGDRTMLEDLLAGVRIPSLIGLMTFENYRPGNDRARIAADCKAYRAALKAAGDGWKDTLTKKVGHLTNYGGSAKRARQAVIEDTYAETGVPYDPGLDLITRGQRCYLSRYWGLPKWWSRTADAIVRTGKLVYATGREREFLSRRPRNGCLDDATRREALAAEPQSITTHVIKTGLLRLWQDLTNWPSGTVGEGTPICQPTIPCVHDEINFQCPIDRFDYATQKLQEWFTVPIYFGRERIVIPFEWGCGPNWGEAKHTTLEWLDKPKPL